MELTMTAESIKTIKLFEAIFWGPLILDQNVTYHISLKLVVDRLLTVMMMQRCTGRVWLTIGRNTAPTEKTIFPDL